MNIILLSGGSGTRLWPLSNNTRSKQFLKLLQAPDNSYESMVQRVYRQLHDAKVAAPILIATSISQADSIRSQLPPDIDIVLEPERRNTFPAIALSCAYLAYEKKVDLQETVMVLPVDPYAQLHYFETLHKMDAAVQADSAELVLMGVHPTYPSEKYGYIVPREDNVFEPYTVDHFTEKPTTAQAETLIAEGAFWNAGVFGFKLGWLLDIVRKQLPFRDYEELYLHYGDLHKDSFDYEVVEKAPSIAMVSYDGVWKDLGTWNTLAEEMDSDAMGDVIIGEDTSNTHVINELNIPVVVLGASNMIVAASPDGILVSDMQKSSNLKLYVNDLDRRPMYEERRWGEYKVLDYNTFSEGQKSLTKHLFIRAGKSISYQDHDRRDEIWTIVDGTGELALDDHVRNVRRGDVAYITKGMKHALRAVTDLHLIEVQIGDDLIEEDIKRYPWEW